MAATEQMKKAAAVAGTFDPIAPLLSGSAAATSSAGGSRFGNVTLGEFGPPERRRFDLSSPGTLALVVGAGVLVYLIARR